MPQTSTNQPQGGVSNDLRQRGNRSKRLPALDLESNYCPARRAGRVGSEPRNLLIRTDAHEQLDGFNN